MNKATILEFYLHTEHTRLENILADPRVQQSKKNIENIHAGATINNNCETIGVFFEVFLFIHSVSLRLYKETVR